MCAASVSRMELLSKDNYDTWKMQMEALLIKNDAWDYANGVCAKPTAAETSHTEIVAWTKWDNKARSEIILSICPSELKQVKGCTTAREVWVKLESIYQSKGPARKATLLKQLTLKRMGEGGDVRVHLNGFFDAVDKLGEMDVGINPDLLAIMLLYSLPSSFENFRCAIESRDELPDPETLRVKIIEENDARKNCMRSVPENAMFLSKKSWYMQNKPNWKQSEKEISRNSSNENEKFKFRCHKCGKYGHKANECTYKKNEKNKDSNNSGKHAKNAENMSYS
jgi:hypothetical protein